MFQPLVWHETLVCITTHTKDKSTRHKFFFVCNVESRMKATTQNVQQREQETRGVGEGRTKWWVTETCDLWERDGGVVHSVNKMDMTGNFRS